MSSRFDQAAAQRAAYVHIPFCHRRCPYCDFAVVDLENEDGPIGAYVAAVVEEIDMESDWLPLHAVNLGGGTPSILEAEQIQLILDKLRSRYGLEEDAEISIEANPEDMSAEYCKRLYQAGVNRVSLGVQSFDAAVLAALGRGHTPDQGKTAVKNLTNAGINNINLDLIFGTPEESLDSWKQTVADALALQTCHLSAYALTVELGTDLSRAVAAGAPAPDDDDQADKYEWLAAQTRSQLDHYEISNWARPGSECRYNLTTWAQGEYLGFGMGAHRHRNGVRSRNHRRLDRYIEDCVAGRQPILGAETAAAWEREKERVFLGIRRRVGVVLGQAGAHFLGSDAGRRFLDAGIVAAQSGRLVVTNPLLTDAVAREVLSLPDPSR